MGVRNVARTVKGVALFLRSWMSRVLLAQSERRLIRDSQDYWSDPTGPRFRSRAHWRGAGPFADDSVWAGLGRRHLELCNRAFEWSESAQDFGVVVEWGSGGGMNAVQIAPNAREYDAVDISGASLEECARQLKGRGNFRPVEIDARNPEKALESIPHGCDLFLSTYVFELLPSPAYGLRIMRIAFELLRPGGVAVVQIRYHHGRPEQLPRRRNYAENLAHVTTYRIDEFWMACEDIGFTPLFVQLLPEQPELHEQRYAYYAMASPSPTPGESDLAEP